MQLKNYFLTLMQICKIKNNYFLYSKFFKNWFSQINTCLIKVPKLTVAAIKFTEGARKRILAAGG
jgi:hypothetical protein